MSVTVVFILLVDASELTSDRIARWLRGKNITPTLFCTQLLPGQTRLIIICELQSFAVGLTVRRLLKLEGVTTLQCLLPKQYNFRGTPAGVLQLMQPD